MTQTGYSEQDVMAEMLSTLKQLKAEMNLLTQEAGTPALYTKAKKMYDHISTLPVSYTHLMGNLILE